MKTKFSNARLSYLFMPRFHSNVLAWVKPASETERSERVIENILRWEDDGGQMLDLGNLMARSDPDTARERADE
jgi:hypothetical protein